MPCSKWHHDRPAGPARAVTADELSRLTGESLKRLDKWRAAGVIGSGDGYTMDDVGKVRLVHELLHYGHSLERIREAFERPDSLLTFFLEETAQELSRPMYSIAEAAEVTGMDIATLRRIVDATGIATTGEMLDDEDLKYLQSSKVAMDAGYPEEGLTQILRVYSDAMSRAAEVSHFTSHFYLHQPAKSELPPEEVMTRLSETFSRIEPLVEPALIYFFRKGTQAAVWDDLLMHLEEQSGLAEPPQTTGQIRRAVMFVDLASFTPLAEAMGDVRAALVLDRFGQLVRKAVRRCHGRIVKQIGDGFMIVFPECYSAVSCGLELEEESTNEPQFPAVRIGLHWGQLLYHEGDYVGSNVNIASRLANEAQRHQFLVTDEVRRRAKDYESVDFVRLGKRKLKGLSAEVEVFEANSVEPLMVERILDPVCGMELGPGEVAARLTLDDCDYAFCSDDCLKQFVKAPAKYN
jgi:adenylate cyclase